MFTFLAVVRAESSVLVFRNFLYFSQPLHLFPNPNLRFWRHFHKCRLIDTNGLVHCCRKIPITFYRSVFKTQQFEKQWRFWLWSMITLSTSSCIMLIPGKSVYSSYFDNKQNRHTDILMLFNCASTETVRHKWTNAPCMKATMLNQESVRQRA